jgi:ribosomal-protein-alanine N-acetyltransferase
MLQSQEGIVWAITLSQQPQMIGTIGYYRSQHQNHRSEIGYELHPNFWGQGIVTEAMRAALDYGFDQMKLHSVEADIDPANLRSARVLDRNHFVKEAHFRENCFFEGRFLDTAIYSLLKSRHWEMTGRLSETRSP